MAVMTSSIDTLAHIPIDDDSRLRPIMLHVSQYRGTLNNGDERRRAMMVAEASRETERPAAVAPAADLIE